MKYYLVCNWKMNPPSFDKAKELISQYNKIFSSKKNKTGEMTEIVICPPFLYFQLLDEKRSKKIKLGAQDLFWKDNGSYTGKISAKMLREFGAQFAIVGHSELRVLGDNDNIVIAKIKEALKKNIIPIVFVGYSDFIKETRIIVNNFSADEVNKMIFVFEPFESIGSGNPEKPEKVFKSIREIKKIIYKRFRKKFFLGLVSLGGRKYLIPKPVLLYGGSVNPGNCDDYLNNTEISGFVIGGESLKPQSIKKIVEKMESY